MTKYATLETKHADLATEFGLDWATQLFGEEAIASLPKRMTGKNKGAPKGFVLWRKALTSGWCRERSHAVAPGQLVEALIGECPLSSCGVQGFWLGRFQELSAGACARVFFEDGRAREAARVPA